MEMFNEKQTSQNSFRDFVTVLFKHKSKVLLLFFIIIVPVIVGTLLATKVYETEAKLFVRLGRETVTRDSASGEQIQISQSMENQLNSEIEILRSREMAEKVVDDLGTQLVLEGISNDSDNKGSDSLWAGIREQIKTMLSFPKLAVAKFLMDPDNPSEIERKKREKAVLMVMENLGADAGEESNVITITYAADDPQLASTVLSRYIDIFLEKHIELHGSPGSFEFFEKESDRLRAQLETAETNLKEMKNEMGVGNLEEQRTILSEQIGALESSREEAESEMASSKARIAALENRLNNLPEHVVVSETTGFAMSAAEEMHSRINELRLQEQELLSTFTENSIPVKEVRRQIREAESLLENTTGSNQVTMGLSEMHQDLKLTMMLENGTIEALAAKKEALDHQIQDAREKLKFLNDAETKLARLQRRKNRLEEDYQRYAESMEQTRIDQAREMEKISNISVAQSPGIPIEPVSPNMRLNLAFGLFLAVFGGLGLAFFMEYMDDKLWKPEQVEDILELPVLGSIKKLEK